MDNFLLEKYIKKRKQGSAKLILKPNDMQRFKMGWVQYIVQITLRCA